MYSNPSWPELNQEMDKQILPIAFVRRCRCRIVESSCRDQELHALSWTGHESNFSIWRLAQGADLSTGNYYCSEQKIDLQFLLGPLLYHPPEGRTFVLEAKLLTYGTPEDLSLSGRI